MRRLSLSPRSSGSRPRCRRSLSAVCQVRVTTSPTRPMACESEDIMLMAPMSWSRSSAAMVSPRMRLSAKATSSGMEGSRWWQTMSMSRCSSSVFTVKGRVGLVDEGSTFGSPHTRRMSGACPPPAPSVWKVWMVRPRQAGVDGGRRGAPVLVELEAQRARRELLVEPLRPRAVALAQEPHVERQPVERAQHELDVARPRRAGGGVRAGGGPGASAEEGRHAARQRLERLLRADEVDVRVDGARREDEPLTGDDLGARPDHHARSDTGHDVRVAGLPEVSDEAALHAHVRLVDAGPIEHERVRDDEIERLGVRDAGALALAVAQHLAAAEHALVAVARDVALHLRHDPGVAEPDPVTGGGAVQRGIVSARDAPRHG